MRRPFVNSLIALLLCSATALGPLARGAQSAKDVVGPTPWERISNEPPPKLIVDAPLAEPLSRGAVVNSAQSICILFRR
jgi:hypothetical protein